MSSGHQPYGHPETRERVLRAAWELIEERGARVRLSDVAQRAGVSRQTVYLHFGDRSGLLLALVEFIDESLGLEEMVAHIFDAPSGEEMLERTIDLYVSMAPRIDRVAEVLEATREADKAVAAAWQNRMDNRQRIHRMIIERISDEGRLAEAWTAEAATDLSYAVTLPRVWRELTRELGWSPDDYRRHITALFQRSLLN